MERSTTDGQGQVEDAASRSDTGVDTGSLPDLGHEEATDAAGAPPADAGASEPPIGDYVFDDIPRKIKNAKTARCPKVELTKYRGTSVPLSREIELDRRFIPKVKRFEEIVAETARQFYGREPARVVHRGGYRCRAVKGRKKRWSEHAFGNAIDVIGFDFAASEKGGEDAAFSEAFEVRVKDHWRATKPPDVTHARFLHTLVRRLVDERVFRIVLGPGDPTHEEILHFDYGRSWYVVVEYPELPADDPKVGDAKGDESPEKK